MRRILSALSLALLCLTAHADQPNNEWKYTLAPYLWFINLNGDAGADDIIVPVNQSFSDLWADLNFAGMLYFDAHYDRLGIFLDMIYTKVSNSQHVNGEKTHVKNVYTVATPGLSYQVIRQQQLSDTAFFTLEPYVGIRTTRNDTTVKTAGTDDNDAPLWSDPLIGTRLIFNFYKQWTLSFTADVGGTTSPDQRSYNIVALGGYEFPNMMYPLSIYGGYRYLNQTYITGSGSDFFEWDMAIFGPVIGLKAVF